MGIIFAMPGYIYILEYQLVSFTAEYCLLNNATCVSQVRKMFININNIMFVMHCSNAAFHMCVTCIGTI